MANIIFLLLISIFGAPWSSSSPAWHHDLHHLDLYQRVVTWSSHQLLLLQLLLSHSDKVKQLFGTCILCNKETTIELLPVADNFNKTWSSQQQLISHHVLTISHHNMPCKNKLDVLYFVVASFTWLLRAEQEPFLPTHQKPQCSIVIAFWSSERIMFIESDSTKIGETDTH